MTLSTTTAWRKWPDGTLSCVCSWASSKGLDQRRWRSFIPQKLQESQEPDQLIFSHPPGLRVPGHHLKATRANTCPPNSSPSCVDRPRRERRYRAMRSHQVCKPLHPTTSLHASSLPGAMCSVGGDSAVYSPSFVMP